MCDSDDPCCHEDDDEDEQEEGQDQGHDVQALGGGAVAACATVVADDFTIPGLEGGRQANTACDPRAWGQGV